MHNKEQRLEAVQNTKMTMDVVNMSVEEMIDKVKNNDKEIKDHISATTKKIEGSEANWDKQRINLNNTVKYVSPPTIFGTTGLCKLYVFKFLISSEEF